MHREPEDERAGVPPGTLHLLILKTLARSALHGYAIAQEIKRRSGEVLQIEEGSLYPALQRMLAKGWVDAEWVPAGPKRRTRVYCLTPAGRHRLETELKAFHRVNRAIVRVIQAGEA